MKEIIRKYIELQKRVNNLTYSTRLEAKQQASAISIEASKLHSDLTSIIEKQLFWYDIKGDIHTNNRSIVGQLLAFCIDFGEPSVYVDGFYITFSFEINEEDFSISLTGEDEEIIIDCDFQEIVSMDEVTSGQYFESADLPEPTIDMASDTLKDFAKKYGYNLIAYVSGSFHQKFGIVSVDFNSKKQ